MNTFCYFWFLESATECPRGQVLRFKVQSRRTCRPGEQYPKKLRFKIRLRLPELPGPKQIPFLIASYVRLFECYRFKPLGLLSAGDWCDTRKVNNAGTLGSRPTPRPTSLFV